MKQKFKNLFSGGLGQLTIPLIAILLLIIFNLIRDPSFFSIGIMHNNDGNVVLAGNLISIINGASELAILAMGMTLVTAACGGQDISVGAVGAIAGAIFVKVLDAFGLNNISAGSIVVGMIAGVKIAETMHPGYESPIAVFFSFMEELGLFRPLNVVIGIGFLVVGFVLYLSLATIAGAISANREEVAANSFFYTMPILAAFMLVMMGGGLTAGGAPGWMNYIPYTAALLMP